MKDFYFFEDGNKNMNCLLGRKGANLCELYNEGFNIPYGFIIPSSSGSIEEAMRVFEEKCGVIGEDILVSVRSSPPISMPGMMESILNVDSYEFLVDSIDKVRKSWNNKRSVVYREEHNISHDLSPAVIVQKMVFGNKTKYSSSGVVFSKNPNDGADEIVGEFLFNSQGDEIVSGKSTPLSIIHLNQTILQDLKKMVLDIESHFRKPQEIEFTIEENNIFILQTKDVTIGSGEENKAAKKHGLLIGKGIPSSYGTITGRVALSSKKAIELKQLGEKVVLVRPETSPDDIEGILASDGIATLQGGATSHAAVVARSMKKPCVCGCKILDVKELDLITINGRSGEVFLHKGEYK